MGKFDGKFIRGLVGKSIFRAYRGQQIIQGVSRKKKIKRTDKTKEASTIFGKSSKLSGIIRNCLNSIITRNYDGGMPSRFNGELLFSLRSALIAETQSFEFKSHTFNRLIGFEFNTASPLKNYFLAQPIITNDENMLHIGIPELLLPQDLKFPERLKHCKLVICTVLFDLVHGTYSQTQIKTLDYSYEYQPLTMPPQQLSFEIEPGCLCITGISLQFYEQTFIGNSLFNNKLFNPAAVLSAFIAGGTADQAKTDKWNKMEFKTLQNPSLLID